ncbi:cytochrome p450 [Colletotrichum graminicola]|nr:cytochrome p450 [Colletotrichum graminicola]
MGGWLQHSALGALGTNLITVEPARRPDESVERARRRLLELTRDGQPVITLQMKRPDEVRLRWARQ